MIAKRKGPGKMKPAALYAFLALAALGGATLIAGSAFGVYWALSARPLERCE